MSLDPKLWIYHLGLILLAGLVGAYVGLAPWTTLAYFHDHGAGRDLVASILGPIGVIVFIFVATPIPALVVVLYVTLTPIVLRRPLASSLLLASIPTIVVPVVGYFAAYADRLTIADYVAAELARGVYGPMLTVAAGVAAAYFLGLKRLQREALRPAT